MKAMMPATARHRYPPVPNQFVGRPRRPSRFFLSPLAAICAVQAVMSLTLVWSNTAFEDEAQFLWAGRLLVAHWLHGTPWPSEFAESNFSGSPMIYPPLGAVTSSVAGIAGARILSLAFMLLATVLLYLTASRLLGQTAAIFAAGLWAITEPVLRLAFASYDPLSVLLTALSAWLIAETNHRRGRPLLVAAAAVALAVANVTAYSGIVIDPVVIVFAFLVWLPDTSPWRALLRAACLAGGCAAVFGLLMTVSHSWAGMAFAVINRSSFAHQDPLAVVTQAWGYSGLIAVLAIVGAAIAVATEGRSRGALVAWLACAMLVVPAAQLRAHTTESLDKHLAYGIWFGVMAAGYGCRKLLRQLPALSKPLAAFCCIIALAYPAAISWEQAWARFHGWADAHQLIASLRPVAAQSRGLIYVPWHEAYITEYYIPLSDNWRRWNSALPLDPSGALSQNRWEPYYAAQLHSGRYGAIVLFYPTTFSSAPGLPVRTLLSPAGAATVQDLLDSVGSNSGEPDLRALTMALEKDHSYRLAAAGPYDSAHNFSIYAVWQKVPD